jgi:hypothetical protein
MINTGEGAGFEPVFILIMQKVLNLINFNREKGQSSFKDQKKESKLCHK